MKIIIILILVELVLNFIILFFIPNKKYFKSDYFSDYLEIYSKKNSDINDTFDNEKNNILLKNDENSIFSDINSDNNNVTNFTPIIDEIEEKLKNSTNMNQTILAFSIIILIVSFVSIYILFLVLLLPKNDENYNGKYFNYLYGFFALKLLFGLINFVLVYLIIRKIKKIKNLDKIGFTNEVKNNSTKMIIISGVCFVFCLVELIFDYKRKKEIYNISFGKDKTEFNYKINHEEDTEGDNNKLKEKNRENEKEINILNDRLNSINNEINVLKKEKEKLNQQINKLTTENINLKKEKKELELRIEENNNLKEKNEELERKIKQKSEEDENLKLKLRENNSKIDKFKEIENQKNIEIQNIKKKYNLNENEKIMTVIFQSVDQNIHYAIICKNTDKFAYIEQDLYEKYPECKEKNYFFLLGASTINRNKTLEENGIKNSDIILVKENELE